MKVIINADDCGATPIVNQHIKEAIEAGKLTSTTIMATEDAVEGALTLYNEYHKGVSFGIHLNLTEGKPILHSKILLDFGLYTENNGSLHFDGAKLESYRYKRLPCEIKEELYKELSAQIIKLRDMGINLSHIDSHHHIHTSFCLVDVIARVSKEFNLPKIRRIRNYKPRSIDFYGRQAWSVLSHFRNHDYIMTDFFAIFNEFFTLPRIPQLRDDSSIELMIHPGHNYEDYQEEERLMLGMLYPSDFELINYNVL